MEIMEVEVNGIPGVDQNSDQELVTEWLNSSAVSQDPSEKLQILYKLQEVLIKKSPQLLPKYISNMLDFALEKNSDIRKALVGFIEEVCKIRESLLPKIMLTLHMLLCDEAIAVQKRVIQAAISIYRKTLQWLCKAPNVTEEMETAWKQMTKIKQEIASLIDSDNDGIRTSTVKFLECVILLQTYPDQAESKKKNDFSLDDVPLTMKIARRRKLEEEASKLFQIVLKFHGSPHISGANLLTCMGVMTNLAKNRAGFMANVVYAIQSLFENLPPTLSATQVNSVRKKLKTELGGLMKHPASYEYLEELTPLLVDLGYSQSEIQKMLPKADERRRYCKRILSSESMLLHQPAKPDEEDQPKTPQEANERYVLANLTLEKAVYLILTSIPKLPTTLPHGFAKEYGSLVKKGNVGDLQVLASILGEQFTEAKIGPGTKIVVKEKPVESVSVGSGSRKRDREKDSDDELEEREKVSKKEKLKVPRIKTLKLSEITKPLDKDVKEKLLLASIQRLLPISNINQKVTITFGSCFPNRVRDAIMNHLLVDIKNNIDTILAWLYEEYSIMQGFSRVPPLRKDIKMDQSYNNLLCTFIGACSHDPVTLSRLFLETPLITDEALDQIRFACKDEKRCHWALGLLKDLVMTKPPKQIAFLNVLLSYTTFESSRVRDRAMEHVLELHKRPDLSMLIEEFARMDLEFLKLQRPPESLSGFNQGRMKSELWTEEFIKACLLPYMSLLPSNQALVHDLAQVYVQTGSDTKRVILRLLESPVKKMGMDSPELLKLVEECPKGAETLVTRVIHVLTDKIPPTPQLVQRVIDLYNTRVSDVRFLIPVLNGMRKSEVIEALPKLIKLNPVVVKEVFNRLLGVHGESPISPTELLVALHLIEPSKADLKTVMKATSMCLQEKHIYTQEVLAVVLQQLMEHQAIPTLLMRTVIQALGSYPRLSGFVMNILQRLIVKQVWKNKVVWEGFVKCCQRTKPQSYAVLLQLPAVQLNEALGMCPELIPALKEHLMSFSESQRQHIPPSVQEIIFGVVPPGETIMPPIVTGTTVALSSNEPLPPGMD